MQSSGYSKPTKSPLRFPGSKSKVLKKFETYLNIEHSEYREPFVGGGAIFFGKKQLVENSWLNDKDINIESFLLSVRDNPIQLCEMIWNIQPTLELWHYYRSQELSESRLIRAFRFLFFNRTNYSGIYNANPIGGLKQLSAWKIDCRWSKEMLCKRIIECSNRLQKTLITSIDYSEVITAPGNNVLLMLDPPYYVKGSKLYPVSMTPEEHRYLAYLLQNTEHKFFLTIDDCPEVRELYSWANIIPETWYYTVNSKKKDNKGKELFITNI
ncbi:DNA adenine methylase [Paenibacillus xylanexedens]|uniref:DNA adenine methylase n=1 Tax=Paenibacillus xylanexedens TaxID=528191 RepID=UPI003D094F6C